MSQQSVRRGRDGRRWMPKQYRAKNVPIENASPSAPGVLAAPTARGGSSTGSGLFA